MPAPLLPGLVCLAFLLAIAQSCVPAEPGSVAAPRSSHGKATPAPAMDTANTKLRPLPPGTVSQTGLKERAPVPPPEDKPEARILSEAWLEVVLPEIPYSGQEVGKAPNYTLSSADDPDFRSPLNPSGVYYRHFPEKAPYKDTS